METYECRLGSSPGRLIQLAWQPTREMRKQISWRRRMQRNLKVRQWEWRCLGWQGLRNVCSACNNSSTLWTVLNSSCLFFPGRSSKTKLCLWGSTAGPNRKIPSSALGSAGHSTALGSVLSFCPDLSQFPVLSCCNSCRRIIICECLKYSQVFLWKCCQTNECFPQPTLKLDLGSYDV